MSGDVGRAPDSELDVAAVLAAVNRAPSVHASQPWLLDPYPGGVDLVERFDVELLCQDPRGRDRAISCGAALTTVVVALRAQGRATRVELLPGKDRPELVAHVTVTGAERPSGADLARHAAIFHRHSHRKPFSLLGLSWRDRDAVATAAAGDGVTMRTVQRKELFPLADLMAHADLAWRDDRACQRELAAWLPRFPQPVRPRSTMPWGGLVRAGTDIPDRFTMADRLGRECQMFVMTDADTRRDHLLAGMALQRAWLRAVAKGLVASVITQPWQLEDVRWSLRALLGDRGFPQVMMRLGRPIVSRGVGRLGPSPVPR